MMTATIAVCTWNRAPLLDRCLASIDTQVAPNGQLEVLVVDNGSTDDTPDLVRRWQRGGDGRRAVVEPRLGVAHARNTALEVSKQDLVLFVDDDALTPPSWANAHLEMHGTDPHVGAVGGPIGLTWPDGRPEWVGNELTQWFSALDFGDDGGIFPGQHGPYAMNMSVRRTAALAAGGFDPRFGRRGRTLLSSEEPGLTHRLQAAGWTVQYAPTAAVIHQVLPERLRRRWLLRRGWAQGVSNARLQTIGESLTRRRRLAQAFAEARTATQFLSRLRTNGHDDLAELVLALAHAGAAAEFTRATFVGTGSPR